MAYDLQEQDQLDAFKAFWNKYGNLLLTVVTVVLLAIAGWRGWGWWQQKQGVEASVVYDQLREAAEKKDIAKVKQAQGQLFEKYSGTVYGGMGALVGRGPISMRATSRRPERRCSGRSTTRRAPSTGCSRGFVWRASCSTRRPTTRV